MTQLITVSTSLPEGVASLAMRIAARFAEQPQVVALTAAGSLPGQQADAGSDLDLYIYSTEVIPLNIRSSIAREFAAANSRIEIGNEYFGPGDEWLAAPSNLHIDLMFWSPDWIEDKVAQVLTRHQASMGYSTCFWYTVLNSLVLFDRDGWYTGLQQQCRQPFPEELAHAIIARNFPFLRDTHSSFRYQISSALRRRDRVSVNHRVAALLASYFDVLFACNCTPHPGEKRLLMHASSLPKVPQDMAQHVEQLITGITRPWDKQSTLEYVDILIDGLEDLLKEQNLLQ